MVGTADTFDLKFLVWNIAKTIQQYFTTSIKVEVKIYRPHIGSGGVNAGYHNLCKVIIDCANETLALIGCRGKQRSIVAFLLWFRRITVRNKSRCLHHYLPRRTVLNLDMRNNCPASCICDAFELLNLGIGPSTSLFYLQRFLTILSRH